MAGWPAHVLPYGAVRDRAGRTFPATAIDDRVVGLDALAAAGHLDGALPDPRRTFAGPALDGLLAAGRPAWEGLRGRLRELADDGRLQEHAVAAVGVTPQLPCTISDYVDFYSSRAHATNVSRILRPHDPTLPPAWDHLPIGYHGRAGSVVVSGTAVRRPCGLHLDEAGAVVDAPEPHLDVEVELGWLVGRAAPQGSRVPTTAFAEHVLGAVLVNDWSARAIQAFEYRPLGPFLSKAFATSVSPWVVPLAALDHARVAPPAPPLPARGHLAPAGDGYDVHLELAVQPPGGRETVVSVPRSAGLRWTPAQQLAHLTATGGGLRSGTLYASGTVSGDAPDQVGCLLEATQGWVEPLQLDGRLRRDGLADGDHVTIRGWAPGPHGAPVPLGEVSGQVLPAGGRT